MPNETYAVNKIAMYSQEQYRAVVALNGTTCTAYTAILVLPLLFRRVRRNISYGNPGPRSFLFVCAALCLGSGAVLLANEATYGDLRGQVRPKGFLAARSFFHDTGILVWSLYLHLNHIKTAQRPLRSVLARLPERMENMASYKEAALDRTFYTLILYTPTLLSLFEAANWTSLSFTSDSEYEATTVAAQMQSAIRTSFLLGGSLISLFITSSRLVCQFREAVAAGVEGANDNLNRSCLDWLRITFGLLEEIFPLTKTCRTFGLLCMASISVIVHCAGHRVTSFNKTISPCCSSTRMELVGFVVCGTLILATEGAKIHFLKLGTGPYWVYLLDNVVILITAFAFAGLAIHGYFRSIAPETPGHNDGGREMSQWD